MNQESLKALCEKIESGDYTDQDFDLFLQEVKHLIEAIDSIVTVNQ